MIYVRVPQIRALCTCALSTYFAPTIQAGTISTRSDFDAINAKMTFTYINDKKYIIDVKYISFCDFYYLYHPIHYIDFIFYISILVLKNLV